jgi:hypothetical protein
MRKLKLDLDAIQVESFTTHAGQAARGTVDGQQRQTFGCPTWTCPPPTQDTCADTCDYSCNGGCGTGNCGTGATCYSCVQTCDVTCASCVATCDDSCAATCGSCMATCNYATGPGRCCA